MQEWRIFGEFLFSMTVKFGKKLENRIWKVKVTLETINQIT